jgi:hypothetical protein
MLCRPAEGTIGTAFPSLRFFGLSEEGDCVNLVDFLGFWRKFAGLSRSTFLISLMAAPPEADDFEFSAAGVDKIPADVGKVSAVVDIVVLTSVGGGECTEFCLRGLPRGRGTVAGAVTGGASAIGITGGDC